MGNFRSTRTQPAWNPYPCAWVWLPCVGTHGLHVTTHHTINSASMTTTTVPPPSLLLRQNSIYTTNTTTTPTTTRQHHDRMRNNEGGDGLSCPSPIIGMFFLNIILLYWLTIYWYYQQVHSLCFRWKLVCFFRCHLFRLNWWQYVTSESCFRFILDYIRCWRYFNFK